MDGKPDELTTTDRAHSAEYLNFHRRAHHPARQFERRGQTGEAQQAAFEITDKVSFSWLQIAPNLLLFRSAVELRRQRHPRPSTGIDQLIVKDL